MEQPSSLLPGPVLHPRSGGAERLTVDEVGRRSEVLSQGQDHRPGRCLVQLGRQVRSSENRFDIEVKDAAEPIRATRSGDRPTPRRAAAPWPANRVLPR